MSRLPTHVTLCEVGPRDGLQNEKELVSTAHKLELIERLQAAGVRRLEATSFVSPKWVPQMADAAAVMAGLNAGLRRPEVAVAVLVPNDKGMDAALPLRPDEIVVFTAASRGLCAQEHQLLDRREHRALRPRHRQGQGRRHHGARRAVSAAWAAPTRARSAPPRWGAWRRGWRPSAWTI
jgi:hydroxymethylglutaryl-CoA lyase